MVQSVLVDSFAQQLSNMALKVCLYFTITLWLAAESLSGVDHGVIVDLNKWLQGDAELMAVIKHRVMVVGNPPGTRVQI
ncbi:hypothetical protein D3C81_1306590 [compost metagenome]